MKRCEKLEERESKRGKRGKKGEQREKKELFSPSKGVFNESMAGSSSPIPCTRAHAKTMAKYDHKVWSARKRKNLLGHEYRFMEGGCG